MSWYDIMNKIEFIIENYTYESEIDERQISIFIDGINLIDIIGIVEGNIIKNGAEPGPIASYAGLPYMTTSREHFLGNDILTFGDKDDKVAILDCTCGCEGCWTLAAKIDVLKDKVVWSDFEQVHRTDDYFDRPWIYNELGQFVFEKQEYMSEINKIHNLKENH